MKTKVLEIGPSCTKARGGMSTVLLQIKQDKSLNEQYDIDFHASYVDGSLPVRLVYSVLAYLKFLIIFRKYHILHIHTASFGSTFRKRWYEKAALKAGKRVIIHIHGAKYLVFYNNLNERKRAKVVDFLRKADCVIALSEGWKEAFVKAFGLTNCVAVNNGINMEVFLPAVNDVAQYASSFVFLGKLGDRKGTYHLIQAVKCLADQGRRLHLVLAGDGEVDKSKSIIHELDLDSIISVPGWIGFEDKVRYLGGAATVVLPSYNEGLPMTILEGMAAGKGVISTDVGAIPEVVEDEINGLIVKPGDVVSLANAMARLMDDLTLLRKMSLQNRRKIEEQYSVQETHRQIAECFVQVMK